MTNTHCLAENHAQTINMIEDTSVKNMPVQLTDLTTNLSTDLATGLTTDLITELDAKNFQQALLTWFIDHGRHDLPWKTNQRRQQPASQQQTTSHKQHSQTSPNPYPVWISEVMLQQTQVKTVIPYFLRFMQSFPNVQSLADAEWDVIADHWAGLGYYARARNLHKGAQQVLNTITQTGDFPQTVEQWEGISGVGRSTAGAIVSMGLHGYGVICDGNVKRVLTRWAGIADDISKSATTKKLWKLAESLTPEQRSGDFAQAMMDMGATICIRKPLCLSDQSICPLQSTCRAYYENKQTHYPVKAKKKPKPSKHSKALIIQNPEQQALWIQRPDKGIWAGLWCLPLQFVKKTSSKKTILSVNINNKKNTTDTVNTSGYDNEAYQNEYTLAEKIIQKWLDDGNDIHNNLKEEITPIKHTLTHFHWLLKPQKLQLDHVHYKALEKLLESNAIIYQWLAMQEAKKSIALPKAMLKIIDSLETNNQ